MCPHACRVQYIRAVAYEKFKESLGLHADIQTLASHLALGSDSSIAFRLLPLLITPSNILISHLKSQVNTGSTRVSLCCELELRQPGASAAALLCVFKLSTTGNYRLYSLKADMPAVPCSLLLSGQCLKLQAIRSQCSLFACEGCQLRSRPCKMNKQARNSSLYAGLGIKGIRRPFHLSAVDSSTQHGSLEMPVPSCKQHEGEGPAL
jgi:hypothetical protein